MLNSIQLFGTILLGGLAAGMLLATSLLMQLFGPLTTQTAIKGFGAARRLSPPPAARAPQGGTPS